jgi:hypothetical protein
MYTDACNVNYGKLVLDKKRPFKEAAFPLLDWTEQQTKKSSQLASEWQYD